VSVVAEEAGDPAAHQSHGINSSANVLPIRDPKRGNRIHQSN
jgi:hypothetical protein